MWCFASASASTVMATLITARMPGVGGGMPDKTGHGLLIHPILQRKGSPLSLKLLTQQLLVAGGVAVRIQPRYDRIAQNSAVGAEIKGVRFVAHRGVILRQNGGAGS